MKFNRAIPLVDILGIIDVEIIGDDSIIVSGINEIHKVEVGDITFVDHPKYYRKSLTSRASIVLIDTKEVENPDGKTLLISNAPFDDYNKLVRHFLSIQIRQAASIDDTAQVHSSASIGDNVTIGAHSIIHPNVSIYPNTIIGKGVIIHANSVIGADAFYYKYKTETGYDRMQSCGRVVIEDGVELGAHCTIDKGVSGDTFIGTGTKIDNMVHIGHGCVLGRECLVAAQVGIAGKTRIGNKVTIWGQVGISKDLSIGDGVTILAQSGISKDLESGKTYFGSPAREARQAMKEMAAIRLIQKQMERK